MATKPPPLPGRDEARNKQSPRAPTSQLLTTSAPRLPPSASTDKMEAAVSAGAGPGGTTANQNAPSRGPANDKRATACCWAAGATDGGGGCRGFEILPERSMSGAAAAGRRPTLDSFEAPAQLFPARPAAVASALGPGDSHGSRRQRPARGSPLSRRALGARKRPSAARRGSSSSPALRLRPAAPRTRVFTSGGSDRRGHLAPKLR